MGDRVLLGYIAKDQAKATKKVGRDLNMYANPRGDHIVPVYAELDAQQKPADGGQREVSNSEVMAALKQHVKNFGTQAKFALQVKASTSYVSDVLAGKREIPEEWVSGLGFRKSGWTRSDISYDIKLATQQPTAANVPSGGADPRYGAGWIEPAERDNESLVHAALELYARSCAYDTKQQHDDAMACKAEIMRRLAAGRVVGDDARLLDAIAHEYWRVEPFDMPTGAGDADVGWRVVSFHGDAPRERTVAEVYTDDVRAALTAALGGREVPDAG